MIRASGADDDVAPCPRLLFRKLRFLVIVDKQRAGFMNSRMVPGEAVGIFRIFPVRAANAVEALRPSRIN